jgi:glycosyltransferase involved in cell wall biosynthesis
MPSRPTAEGERDGIPTVLIEAMAHSTVVVASDFAGIPELVHDGLTGRLVPPESPVALARTLSSLSNRPGERDYMRRQGRKRILRDYNLEREVGKLQALMRSVKP